MSEDRKLSNRCVTVNGELDWSTTKSDETPNVVPSEFIGFGTTQPPPDESMITFTTNGYPVLDFRKDGSVFVRGELVDTNQAVYEALLDFLETTGLLDNWKRNGY